MFLERMTTTLLVLALAMSAPSVSAQTVQKCVGQDGAVTFTSGECPVGQDAVASYEAQPEQPDRAKAKRLAELERWKQANDARRASSRAGGHRPSRSGTSGESRHARCEAAKRHREAQLERLGLRRTHADLRRLDGPVRAACG